MSIGLAANQNSPETTVNKSDVGHLNKDVAGGADIALTDSEATYAQIEFTGALTASINVTALDAANLIWVYNNTSGAYTLAVMPVAGVGITVTQGTRCLVGFDGAGNAYKWTAEL